MNFTGKIKQISPLVSGTSNSGKDWSKQSVLVEEIDKEYPNSMVFEAFNKPLDGLANGMMVNVDFNAKGSEYNGKLYNLLSIWKIEKAFSGMRSEVQPVTQSEQSEDDDDGSGLPF